jgi:hypothetical protein
MTDTTDTTVATNETPKQRGRKKILRDEAGNIIQGSLSPRKILMTCAAVVDEELVMETVHCANCSNTSTKDEVVAEACRLFTASQDLPDGTDIATQGPFYPREGTQVPAAKKRDSVSVDISQYDLKNAGTAVYKGWNISVKSLVGREDVVYILYKNHTTEEKKSTPTAKAVLRSALENFQPV